MQIGTISRCLPILSSEFNNSSTHKIFWIHFLRHSWFNSLSTAFGAMRKPYQNLKGKEHGDSVIWDSTHLSALKMVTEIEVRMSRLLTLISQPGVHQYVGVQEGLGHWESGHNIDLARYQNCPKRFTSKLLVGGLSTSFPHRQLL